MRNPSVKSNLMSKTVDLKDYYEKDYVHIDDIGFEENVVADIKTELLLSIFPGEVEVSSFLDIGCGKGNILERLIKKIKMDSAVGLEFSHANLKEAKDKLSGAEFVCASSEELPFRNGSFEFSLCMDVYEHVPDYAAAIREQARVSKRFFVIKIPLEKNLLHYLRLTVLPAYLLARRIIKGKPMTPPFDPHINKFTEKGFTNSLGREGIKVLRKRVSGLPGDPDFDEFLFRERKRLEREQETKSLKEELGERLLVPVRICLKKLCFLINPKLYKMIFLTHLYLFCEKNGGKK